VLSFFGSFEVGTDAFGLSAIPPQSIVGKVEPATRGTVTPGRLG